MIVTQPLVVRLVLSVLLRKITNLRNPKIHALTLSLAESSPRRPPSQEILKSQAQNSERRVQAASKVAKMKRTQNAIRCQKYRRRREEIEEKERRLCREIFELKLQIQTMIGVTDHYSKRKITSETWLSISLYPEKREYE